MRKRPHDADAKVCKVVSFEFISSSLAFAGLAAVSAHYTPALAVWRAKKITPVIVGAAAFLLAVVLRCAYAILACLCNRKRSVRIERGLSHDEGSRRKIKKSSQSPTGGKNSTKQVSVADDRSGKGARAPSSVRAKEEDALFSSLSEPISLVDDGDSVREEQERDGATGEIPTAGSAETVSAAEITSPKREAGAGIGLLSEVASSGKASTPEHPFFQQVSSQIVGGADLVDWFSKEDNVRNLPKWCLKDNNKWETARQQIHTYLVTIEFEGDKIPEKGRCLEALLSLGTCLYDQANKSQADNDSTKWLVPMRCFKALLGYYDASTPQYVGIQAAFVHLIVTKIPMTRGEALRELIQVLMRGKHSPAMQAFVKKPTKENGLVVLLSLDVNRHKYVGTALQALEDYPPVGAGGAAESKRA